MTDEALTIEFSNYERTVWIVNSVEGHLLRYYEDVLVYFDRFPAFPQADGQPLTPDFAASFISDFNIIGEVKRALGLDQRTIDENYRQICNYDQPLKFRTTGGGAHEHDAASHDIVVFVNVEHAQKEAKRLRQLIDEHGKPERPVIVFSVAFDQQQAKARWVLSCITSRSGRFSDAELPEDKRLSKRHQDDEEPIVIYTNEFAALQATQAFCNDKPPAIYTAVILWARVFPRLMPTEQRASWALDENLQGIVEFSTTVDAVVAEKNRLLLSVRRSHVLEALNLLEAGSLLVRKDNDELIVRYRRFRPRGIDIDEKKRKRFLKRLLTTQSEV